MKKTLIISLAGLIISSVFYSLYAGPEISNLRQDSKGNYSFTIILEEAKSKKVPDKYKEFVSKQTNNIKSKKFDINDVIAIGPSEKKNILQKLDDSKDKKSKLSDDRTVIEDTLKDAVKNPNVESIDIDTRGGVISTLMSLKSEINPTNNHTQEELRKKYSLPNHVTNIKESTKGVSFDLPRDPIKSSDDNGKIRRVPPYKVQDFDEDDNYKTAIKPAPSENKKIDINLPVSDNNKKVITKGVKTISGLFKNFGKSPKPRCIGSEKKNIATSEQKSIKSRLLRKLASKNKDQTVKPSAVKDSGSNKSKKKKSVSKRTAKYLKKRTDISSYSMLSNKAGPNNNLNSFLLSYNIMTGFSLMNPMMMGMGMMSPYSMGGSMMGMGGMSPYSMGGSMMGMGGMSPYSMGGSMMGMGGMSPYSMGGSMMGMGGMSPYSMGGMGSSMYQRPGMMGSYPMGGSMMGGGSMYQRPGMYSGGYRY